MSTHTEQLLALLEAVPKLEAEGYVIASTETSAYNQHARVQLSHRSKTPPNSTFDFESKTTLYFKAELHGVHVWWGIDKPERIEEAA